MAPEGERGLKVGVLGVGVISCAVVDAIAPRAASVLVSQRGQANSADLEARHRNVSVAVNQAVLDGSDIVVLGLHAEVAENILPTLEFRADHRVVSLMALLNVEQVSSLVAPAVDVTLAIPFPFVAKGRSPVLLSSASDTAAALFPKETQFYIAENQSDFEAFMAAQAVLSPVLKMLEQTSLWLSEHTGRKNEADHFLRLLVGGSLMARSDNESAPFATMLEELNAKGGLNAQLRDTMVAAGCTETLLTGLHRLRQRLAGA